MSEYQRLYRQAEVRERWADVYGGDTVRAEWMRLYAATDRFWAELIKAFWIEEAAAWCARRIRRWNP